METTRLEPYHAPEETLAALRDEGKILCLGGLTSRHVLVSTDFCEESVDRLEHARIWRAPSVASWTPSRVIVASYSDFACDGGAASRAFFLRSGWIWDQQAHALSHFTRTPGGVPVAPPRVAALTAEPSPVRLTATNDHYPELAQRAIDDIKAGRFYQINLLRFFQAEPPSAEDLLCLWASRAGEMGVFLRTPDLDLISFSPERLVALTSEADHLKAIAEPIKGTVPVGDDPREREAARRLLASAHKERAELAIITDLLRNDLFRIAKRHGVRVVARGAPVSAAGVEHFKSVIAAICPSDLTFGALCRALLPGGSITGAPKLEVMKAIRAYEGRPRDYFMGSVFVLDEERGALDASILIRTLVRRAGGPWEYAAGSGLTVASDPTSEAAEILAKCRVVTTP